MNKALMNTTWLQGRLNDLYALHKNTIEDYGTLVQSLNQEVDILCEIIPGYKITSNMTTEQQQQQGGGGGGDEKQQQRKQKEVYNVEKLETESLKQYQHFLELIAKLQRKPHPEEQALGCRLCCRLIPYAYSFNCNDRLLRLAVNFANAKSTRVAQPALKALSDMLSDQVVSEATQFVVDAILEIVRKANHALNPKILTLLLSIRVAMIDVHKPDIAEEKAKLKRMKKEDKELARQLRKANARQERAELAARQTRILNRVFVIYLRVLQASKTCASKEHQAKILAPTLEGLVKFAPLVNQELFRELSSALKELLSIKTKKQIRDEMAAANYNSDYYGKAIQLGHDSRLVQSQQQQQNQNQAGGGGGGGGGYQQQVQQQEQQQECTVTTSLHALVAAAALANKDETLEAIDWKEDLVDYQEKLFQLLPEALTPPEIPKQKQQNDEDDENNQDQNNDDAKSSASSVVSTTSSLASTAFSIAQSMANHNQYVRGSVMREWTYRCNLVVRAFDSLILSQRHLPTARVAALVRRIVNLATNTPHHISMSLVALAHRTVLRFPGTGGMFMGGADYEGGATTGAGGKFRFDATELSGGNPDGVFTWEETLLRRSYQPALRDVGVLFSQHYQRLSQTKPGQVPPVSKQLDSLFPDEILERFDPSSGLIVPAPPIRSLAMPKRRSRHQQIQQKQQQNQNQNQTQRRESNNNNNNDEDEDEEE